MGQRQRKWAAKKRDEIFELLGYECKKCGATKELEFDVIVPFDDRHHEMEWSWRMSFYRKQLRAKNLQILCRICNGKKQRQLELTSDLQPDDPF